jgi:hypothetical protein
MKLLDPIKPPVTYPTPPAILRPRERVEITIPVVISYDNEEARQKAFDAATQFLKSHGIKKVSNPVSGFTIEFS